MDIVDRQERMLVKEVRKFCTERGEEIMGVMKERAAEEDNLAAMQQQPTGMKQQVVM